MIIKGIPVSPGLAAARCLLIRDGLPADGRHGADGRHLSDKGEANTSATTEAVAATSVSDASADASARVITPESEADRAAAAIAEAGAQLERIGAKAAERGDEECAAVMDAQSMLLLDPSLEEAIRERILAAGTAASADAATAATLNAATATLNAAAITRNAAATTAIVRAVLEERAQMFEAMDDAYFQERAQDIRDIGARVARVLDGIEEQDISSLDGDVILVGVNITPSLMASADRAHVKGIVSQIGGKTCHTAILARNRDIPAVFGVPVTAEAFPDDAMLAVDGGEGTVRSELSETEIEALRERIGRMEQTRRALDSMIGQPSVTTDGAHLEISANLMQASDAARALELGADGVGLFRTEFLYMDRSSAPGEEEQTRAYAAAAAGMAGKPVIIRTMDIGGDKEVPYLGLPKEENPFIGYRAIRICLDDRELFKTQLRAILRASVQGSIRVMFPMIATLEEFRAAKAVVHECMAELDARGQAYDRNLPIGLMIEVPSAAMIADLLIAEADFLSIGTNDLTQYTLAVDRMNEKLSGLYNPYSPGVLRMISRVTGAVREAAGTSGAGLQSGYDASDATTGAQHHAGFAKFAGMCGEMAGDPYATILLIGLGLTEFSVNPSSVVRIRKIASLVSKTEAEAVAAHALTLGTAAEVEKYLRETTERVAGAWL